MIAPPHDFTILTLKGKRVVVDFQLAALFHVPTRELKQAARRYSTRFDEEAMIMLGPPEINELIYQKLIPNRRALCGAVPFAFTVLGVALLSTVLRSPAALEVNKTMVLTYLNLFPYVTLEAILLKTKAKVERVTKVHYNGAYHVIRNMLSEQVSYHAAQSKSKRKQREEEDLWW